MAANFKKIKDLSKRIRLDALDMVYRTKSSHIGSALSAVEIISVLYTSIMKHDPKNPILEKRDRFLISKGHACTCMYGLMAELGYIEKEELLTYATDGCRLMSHVSHKVPGIEFSTGSLGHALPISLGLALASKRKKQNFRVFVLLSDGELDEGSNWEAFLMAPHLKLDNLMVVVDYNKIQALGNTNEVINLEPLLDKFETFNWDFAECDGHSAEDIYEKASKMIEVKNGKPKLLLAHTVKGKGVSFMENSLAWHYKSMLPEEYEQAVKEVESK